MLFLISNFKSYETPPQAGLHWEKTNNPRATNRAKQTKQDSGEGGARRGRRRCFGEGLGHDVTAGRKPEAGRDSQYEIFRGGRKFKRFEVRRGLSFFLRLFPGRNRFAQGAWVLAVESPRDRLGEGIVAQIIRQHGSPGHMEQASASTRTILANRVSTPAMVEGWAADVKGGGNWVVS
jgi:hypothetical protein